MISRVWSPLLALALVGCPGSESGEGGAAGGGAGNTEGGLAIVPCPDDLPEFALGLEELGDEETYKVVLTDATPSPPERYINDWKVMIVDADDNPVEEADLFEVEPFMPVHGHDGRMDPVITPTDEAGEFEVDQINLWMRGPWEVRFRVRGDAGEDYVVFDVCVE